MAAVSVVAADEVNIDAVLPAVVTVARTISRALTDAIPAGSAPIEL